MTLRMQQPGNRTHFYGLSRIHRSLAHAVYSHKGVINIFLFGRPSEKDGLMGSLSMYLSLEVVVPPAEVIQLSEMTSSGFFQVESRTISQVTVFAEICPERDKGLPHLLVVFLSLVLFVVLLGDRKHDQELSHLALNRLFVGEKGGFSSMTPFLGRIRVNMGLICILD